MALLVLGALVLDVGGDLLDDLAVAVRGVLPEGHSGVVAKLVVGPLDGGRQFGDFHVPGVTDIPGGGRLTSHQLSGGDLPLDDFLEGGAVEVRPSGVDEELFIGVVPRVDLVVKLNVVEVYQFADGLMHCDVAVVGVELVLEVGRLGAMSDHPVRNSLTQRLRERDQPLLTSSPVHSGVVLPVDIGPVEVLVDHELSELLTALSRVGAGTGRKLGVAKRTHHDLDAGLVVQRLDALLDFAARASELGLVAEVELGVTPHLDHVLGDT